MPGRGYLARVLAVTAATVASSLALLQPAAPAAAVPSYRTGHASWATFAAWRLDGAQLRGGAVRLAPGRKAALAVSPVVRTGFGAREAIPSWNAATPRGTWVEPRVRARVGGRWTRWYRLGSWSSVEGARRHSAGAQRDANGRVATDTVVLARRATALQVGLRLRSTRAGRSPSVRFAALAFSERPERPEELERRGAARRLVLGVPEYSQMVYPDGGEVWCSPTSISMVLAYWKGYGGRAEPRVRRTVRGVYDRGYRGHGNWPFGAAYAATEGMRAQVARFSSLREAERWIAAGVPVVFSFAWGAGDLDGAAIRSSAGHLAVLVGFERDGDPIVNDPAARTNRGVRRTYPRAQLERLWLEHSGGTVYLIHPPGPRVPTL